jgi:hypothetical protein
MPASHADPFVSLDLLPELASDDPLMSFAAEASREPAATTIERPATGQALAHRKPDLDGAQTAWLAALPAIENRLDTFNDRIARVERRSRIVAVLVGLAVLALAAMIAIVGRTRWSPVSVSRPPASLLSARLTMPQMAIPAMAFVPAPARLPLNASPPGSQPLQQSPAPSAVTGDRRIQPSASPPRSQPLRQPPAPSAIPGGQRIQTYVGVLTVVSDPSGATVFVDGKPEGTTPLQLQRVQAGSHAVWVAYDGYDRWTAAVRVPADSQTRISAKLQPHNH